MSGELPHDLPHEQAEGRDTASGELSGPQVEIAKTPYKSHLQACKEMENCRGMDISGLPDFNPSEVAAWNAPLQAPDTAVNPSEVAAWNAPLQAPDAVADPSEVAAWNAPLQAPDAVADPSEVAAWNAPLQAPDAVADPSEVAAWNAPLQAPDAVADPSEVAAWNAPLQAPDAAVDLQNPAVAAVMRSMTSEEMAVKEMAVELARNMPEGKSIDAPKIIDLDLAAGADLKPTELAERDLPL